MKKRDQINEWLEEMLPDVEILLADGFEDAFIGVAFQNHNPISIFDYEKCLTILQKNGMSLDEAEEYLQFNVVNSYMGEQTPAFFFKFKDVNYNENFNN
jgi:hypothetical protein